MVSWGGSTPVYFGSNVPAAASTLPKLTNMPPSSSGTSVRKTVNQSKAKRAPWKASVPIKLYMSSLFSLIAGYFCGRVASTILNLFSFAMFNILTISL